MASENTARLISVLLTPTAMNRARLRRSKTRPPRTGSIGSALADIAAVGAVGNHERWAVLQDFVDARDVSADDPEHDEHHAEEERHQRGQRRPPGHRLAA